MYVCFKVLCVCSLLFVCGNIDVLTYLQAGFLVFFMLSFNVLFLNKNGGSKKLF